MFIGFQNHLPTKANSLGCPVPNEGRGTPTFVRSFPVLRQPTSYMMSLTWCSNLWANYDLATEQCPLHDVPSRWCHSAREFPGSPCWGEPGNPDNLIRAYMDSKLFFFKWKTRNLMFLTTVHQMNKCALRSTCGLWSTWTFYYVCFVPSNGLWGFTSCISPAMYS